MIHVKKPDAPAFLTDPNDVWFEETESAIQHYTQPGQSGSFKFERYREPELKDALIEVFGSKCAYCESPYGAVYDGDVEHFRPKGRVDGKVPDTPGYFWLANDWENLLLSCMHCNQRRKHKMFDGKTSSAGKLDKFPLTDEGKRAAYRAGGVDLSEEDKHRLLIHPCKDNPEPHFEYDEQEGVIRGVTDQGKKSIEVFVLQRVRLVQERRKILDQLFFHLALTRKSLERYNEDPTPKNKDDFDSHVTGAKMFTAADRAYAGMCRYFFRRFMKENGLL